MEIKRLRKNAENNRYNYQFVKDVGSREMAKLLESEIRNGSCMSFNNGMGYLLSVKGKTLVLKTNRCRYSPSVEMSINESAMIQEVFTSRVRNALYNIYERTNVLVRV